MKLVLFDIDGTLMLGYGAGTRAMIRAGRALCGDEFSLEGIMIGGGLDPVMFGMAAGRLGLTELTELHLTFRDRYLRELAQELAIAERKAQLLPGVAELLLQLEARDDVLLGLVTGNYRAAVPIKFASVGLALERFPIGAFGDCGPTRPDLVRVALERAALHYGARIDPAHTFVVGDTPRDVDCALHNGCVCLAVATGSHSADELTRAGAHHVVPDLRDASVLLSLLG
jgi:phosphoglycolate phosphatase